MPDVIYGSQIFDYADGANVVNASGWHTDKQYRILGWDYSDAFSVLLLEELV